MFTIFDNEKKVKHLSRELAISINAVIRGQVDSAMIKQKLDSIETAFVYDCKYFKLLHHNTMVMCSKYCLTIKAEKAVYLIGFAYSQLVILFNEYVLAVRDFYVTGNIKNLLKDLKYIRRGIRSIYL